MNSNPRGDNDAMEVTHAHIRDVVARAAVVVGLAGIALIHLLDSIGKFKETPYVAWLYVALMVGALVAGALLIVSRSKIGFAAAATLAAAAIAGYVVSRTVGLPNATDDIGNWTEPLGLAALFVEGCVVAVSVPALALRDSRLARRGHDESRAQQAVAA
jgi:hypothetical protein